MSSRSATGGWRVVTAESTGAHHRASGRPREDALAVLPASSAETTSTAPVAVAIADGHGHARHFRSERGAAFAVEVATRLGAALGTRIAKMTDRDDVYGALREHMGGKLVDEWRDAVIADVGVEPVTPAEYKSSRMAENATIDDIILGYGATLLTAVAAGRWLALAQLGDGDMFVVGAAGTVIKPVPTDDRLDGLRTTSLCQPDAEDSIRYAVIDTSTQDVGAVMIATDGYGNAQARNDWEAAFGADLAGLAAANGVSWIKGQLPAWADLCASSDGSGDDVTVALMFAGGAAWQPQAPKSAAVTERDVMTARTAPVLPATPKTPGASDKTVRISPDSADLTVPVRPNSSGAPQRPAASVAGSAAKATSPKAAAPQGAVSRAAAPQAAAPQAAEPQAVAPRAAAPQAVAQRAVSPSAGYPQTASPGARPPRSASTTPEPVGGGRSRRSVVLVAIGILLVVAAIVAFLLYEFLGGSKPPQPTAPPGDSANTHSATHSAAPGTQPGNPQPKPSSRTGKGAVGLPQDGGAKQASATPTTDVGNQPSNASSPPTD